MYIKLPVCRHIHGNATEAQHTTARREKLTCNINTVSLTWFITKQILLSTSESCLVTARHMPTSFTSTNRAHGAVLCGTLIWHNIQPGTTHNSPRFKKIHSRRRTKYPYCIFCVSGTSSSHVTSCGVMPLALLLFFSQILYLLLSLRYGYTLSFYESLFFLFIFVNTLWSQRWR